MRKAICFIFQLCLAVVLVLSLVPASVEAVPVTIDFQGTLQSSQSFSGSFTYDTDTLPAFVFLNTVGGYSNAGTLSVSIGNSTWTGANAFVTLIDLAGTNHDAFSVLSTNISGPSISPSELSLFFSGPSALSTVLSLPSVFPTNFENSFAGLGFNTSRPLIGSISSVSVPEPSSFMLMGIGLIAAALTVRKINKR